MQQIYLMLGRLLERSEHQTHCLSEIKSTLTRFDARLTTIESRRGFRMPPVEKIVKDFLTWALPIATLAATGSLDKALLALQASGGN